MINRRIVLAGAASLAFVRSASSAEDWKAKYPEITFVSKKVNKTADGYTLTGEKKYIRMFIIEKMKL